MEHWKTEIGSKALQEGIIQDPHWLNKLDEPMPVWAILELIIRLNRKIDPPDQPYD